MSTYACHLIDNKFTVCIHVHACDYSEDMNFVTVGSIPYTPVQCSFGATILNSPQDLDGLNDNSSVIVAGSVIQLFCSASGQFTAPHIQWTMQEQYHHSRDYTVASSDGQE